MKIISWNIRGLNERTKQRILQNNILTENPNILLLQETKCAGTVAENLLSKSWKRGNFMFTDSRGAAGGLAILWNPTIIIMENFYSTRWTLSASYRLIGTNKTGLITNVYGP
jgi:exonuclease III